MRRLPLTIFLGLLVAASTASATTYVRVEKDGTKTYSDRPLPGGQPVDLQPAQTYSAPPPSAAVQSSKPLEQELLGQVDDFRYASCETSPKQDESFTNPDRLSIGVSLQPVLRPGDMVDLRLDGNQLGDGATMSINLPPPFDRGSHTVAVTVKDRFGRTLCSATSTFHVFRPSVNMPGRASPVRPQPRN
jgi:hypothetical protein